MKHCQNTSMTYSPTWQLLSTLKIHLSRLSRVNRLTSWNISIDTEACVPQESRHLSWRRKRHSKNNPTREMLRVLGMCHRLTKDSMTDITSKNRLWNPLTTLRKFKNNFNDGFLLALTNFLRLREQHDIIHKYSQPNYLQNPGRSLRKDAVPQSGTRDWVDADYAPISFLHWATIHHLAMGVSCHRRTSL